MIINNLEKIANYESGTDKYTTQIGRGPTGVQVSKSGHLLVIRPRVRVPIGIRPSLADRKEITGFSKSSASRLRKYLRECLPNYSVLITLTYPHGLGFNGAECKRHLSVFLKRLRRYVGTGAHDYSTCWVSEFQQRGAIHYHLFTTHRFPKEWIARCWYEIVGSEDQRHLRAGTRIESIRSGKKGISAYACKYAAKETQKVVPEGFGWVGRFWGVSGWRATVSADTWLEPEDLGTKAVMRQLNYLERLINEEQRKGKCNVSAMEGGTYVVYMKGLYLEMQVKEAINKIESAVRLYRIPNETWLNIDYESRWGNEDGDEVL